MREQGGGSSRTGSGNDFRFREPRSMERLHPCPRSWPVGHQGSWLGAMILGQSAADSARWATVAAAGPDRSKHWKRSTPPLAHSAKAIPRSSFPARAGLAPRRRVRGSGIDPVVLGYRTFLHRPLIQNWGSFPDPVPNHPQTLRFHLFNHLLIFYLTVQLLRALIRHLHTSEC
jgi:hypothetical protein